MPSTLTKLIPKQKHSFRFDKENHVYYDVNNMILKSVSQHIKDHEPDIDFHALALNKAGGDIEDAVKLRSEWNKKRDTALDFGIAIDKAVEKYLLTGEEVDYLMFKRKPYQSRFYRELEYVKSELADEIVTQMPFIDPCAQIGGTPDIVFFQKARWNVADIKTGKDRLVMQESFNHKGHRFKPPYNQLPYCTLAKYAIQLSIYANLIYENGNAVNFDNMKIFHVRHCGSIETIDVPYLNEVDRYFLPF